MLSTKEQLFAEDSPLNGQLTGVINDHNLGSLTRIPRKSNTQGGFSEAVKRLLKNKVLMFNIFSGVFYILGSSGYITFIAKYMEVQFHKSSSDATIITGPATLLGMVCGMLASGFFISKRKPRAKYLLFWNVIVGVIYMCGQFTNLFLTCPDGKMPLVAGNLINLTTECNSNCICDKIRYSPVCHEETGVTFFSPCHAGCQKWHEDKKYYSQCSCAEIDSHQRMINTETYSDTTQGDLPYMGSMKKFSISPSPISDDDYDWSSFSSSLLSSSIFSSTIQTPTSIPVTKFDVKKDFQAEDFDEDYTSDREKIDDDYDYDRRKRDTNSDWGVLLSGACLKGCAFGFYAFTTVSALINIFGASGRIGNLLVNYR